MFKSSHSPQRNTESSEGKFLEIQDVSEKILLLTFVIHYEVKINEFKVKVHHG